MSVKGKTRARQLSFSVTIFSLQPINYGQKSVALVFKVNLRPELKMKVVWNTCDKELGGEMKSAYENYLQSSLENFQKSLLFRKMYVKYLEKK